MFSIKDKRQIIEFNNVEYEIDISLLQIEITNKCNYLCKHCRAGTLGPGQEINLNDISTTIDFIRLFNPKFSEVTISGGEPLLSSNLMLILKMLRQKEIRKINITTNASMLDEILLIEMLKIDFMEIHFSISIEYLDKKKFNEFRGNVKAYDNVFNALKLISKIKNSKLTCALRVSVAKDNIQYKKLENFVKESIKYECKKIKFSPILPVGKAIKTMNFLSRKEELQKLEEYLGLLKKKYDGKVNVETNDPIMFLDRKPNNCYSVAGCGAGLISLNLMVDGNLSLCSLLPDEIICNVREKHPNEIIKAYKNSMLIKQLLTRNYIGKCGKCSYKYRCGGCRARALALSGNVLESDGLCFY